MAERLGRLEERMESKPKAKRTGKPKRSTLYRPPPSGKIRTVSEEEFNEWWNSSSGNPGKQKDGAKGLHEHSNGASE
jgi:hypothetical protein